MLHVRVVDRITLFTVNNTMYASKVEVLNLLWKAWYSIGAVTRIENLDLLPFIMRI